MSHQDTVEVYLVFFVCYLILFPLQVHAVIRQRHIVPRLFTGSVVLELAAVLANVVDVLKFSVNGVGHPSLAAFGDVMDIAARVMFIPVEFVHGKFTTFELTSFTGNLHAYFIGFGQRLGRNSYGT